MNADQALLRVQSAYPRIYLACHARHQNARTTALRLSQRDGTLLSHLNDTEPLTQSALAKHLGVAKSTLSEALTALERSGYVTRGKQGRQVFLLRTPAGARAMSGSSVLESIRLRRLLNALTGPERLRAVEGLELLAKAGEKK